MRSGVTVNFIQKGLNMFNQSNHGHIETHRLTEKWKIHAKKVQNKLQSFCPFSRCVTAAFLYFVGPYPPGGTEMVLFAFGILRQI